MGLWTGSPKTWLQEFVASSVMNAEIRDRFNAVQRLLDCDVTATTVVSTSSETTVYSFTVPANTLGTDRRLRLSLKGEFLNDTGGNSTPTLRVKWGGSTRATFAPTLSASATPRAWILDVDLNAEDATDAQRLIAESTVTTPISDGTAGTKAAEQLVRHYGLTVDATVDQVVSVTIQHDGGTSTRSFTRHASYLELMPF